MAIEAKFFTVAKRENSTYKPTENATTLNITLKEITDVLTPVIEVNYSGAFTFNMCYIDFFNRWYKIRDVESIAHNAYTLALDVDVLATWIDDVLGQSVTAEYSSYDYNVNIDDGRITPTNLISTVVDNGGKPTFLTDVPYQFLSVITSSGELSGTDIFYNTAASGQFGTFIQSLSDISFWDSLQQGGVASNQCNAFDFLNDLYMLPFIPDFCHTVTTKSTQILSEQIGGNCLADVSVKRYTYTFGNIPRPSSNDFRYSSKYVKYYLNLPYVGVINVPTELVKAAVN